MFGIHDDDQARALLQTAADSIPGTSDPLADDLLAGVRSRRIRSRRRTRLTLSLGTATALAGGAIAAVLATTATGLVGAQSAYAAVTAAATTTSSQSFRMTLAINDVSTHGGPGLAITYVPSGTGLFNPASRVGEMGSGPRRAVFADGWEYLQTPRAKFTDDKPWIGIRDATTLPIIGLMGPLPTSAADSATPQSLFGLLKKAREVRADGAASGPGWTGTRYTFSYANERGTVIVDQQGRVREIDLALPLFFAPRSGKLSARPTGTVRVSASFGDFGVHVSVTPPPASEVFFEPGS
jgi:hypothetical protein